MLFELICITGPIAQLVERPLSEWEVVGSNPSCSIPKVEKMVLAAPLLTLAQKGVVLGR